MTFMCLISSVVKDMSKPHQTQQMILNAKLLVWKHAMNMLNANGRTQLPSVLNVCARMASLATEHIVRLQIVS